MEKIRIKNFAGIEELSIELNRVNLFIGRQASGKSITAKLIYYFKGVTREFFESALAEKSKQQLEKKLLLKFSEYFPSDTWPSKSFEIMYSSQNGEILIKKQKSRLFITLSQPYLDLYGFAKSIIKSDKSKFKPEDQFEIYRPNYKLNEKYLTLVQKELGPSSAYNPLFIPAGRSFFANLQSSIFSFLSNNKAMDPFLVEFGSFYENIKPIAARNPLLYKDDKQISVVADKIIYEIIGSKYLREKNKDYLVHADKRKIDVSFTSSGQQETLPLILILKALLRVHFLGEGTALFVEEPEAHLFPAAQKKVIELMGLVFNNSKTASQMVITTHSPYVLTSLNNLIQANMVYRNAKPTQKDRITQVIPKSIMIKENYLNAFAFKNGTAESIIDSETKLIGSNYLDAVSEDISIEFDKLIDFENV